ncbi:MAG: glutathione peroxidase [Bacteroidetes bacterium]|nr:glutathione peroxidase [Bacteroidota bacterium]
MRSLFYQVLRRVVSNKRMDNTHNIPPAQDIYAIPVMSIQGEEMTLEKFKGKKILIVNTASECGYTPQYESLQKLHELHGKKIAVLGFPCNDFGAQEPDDEKAISSFCELNYGVTFPLFSKIHVVGKEKHPLYAWLSDPAKNGWNSQKPTWNFCKYLVDEEGKLLHFFNAAVDPLDKLITG